MPRVLPANQPLLRPATAPPVPHPEITERLRLGGALVVDPTIDDEFVELLVAEAIPFVTTGRAPDGGASTYWVDNDHESGTMKMHTHLIESGAETVAVVSTAPVYSYVLDLHRAYERWCASRSQAPRVLHVDAPTEDAGFRAATELLSGNSPPEAIYASFDRLGIGVLRAAQARDVDVPRELRVASLSDSDAARTIKPSLTTLNLHPAEIGKRGIDMLISLVSGEEPASRHSLIDSTVLERESTQLKVAS